MARSRFVWLICVLLVATGCSKNSLVTQDPLRGEKAKAGAMLAYEHVVQVVLPAAQVTARLAAARDACDKAQFGACDVLRIEQGEHNAVLAVRIVPAGVEPLAALAGQGGKVSHRQTTAVDLADAVHDNQRQRDQLERQSQQLIALSLRKDLAVADMIALAREQAVLETQLQSLQKDSAGQQRRLETNRLELHFRGAGSDSRSGRMGRGFGGLLDSVVDGISDALELLGYGLPFLILAFPLAMLWRALWRRFTRRG